jgi:large subunit ribosomal protein L31
MKPDIHPKYFDCQVTCGCGNKFQTRATVKELHIEICGVCHPFYSGKQKFVDAAGRVDRYVKKYGAASAKKPAPAKAVPAEQK